MSTLCMRSIDYSMVEADPLVPFTFTLDEAASLLNPGPGENQRFCYRIVGVGEDTSDYADLSHFVLGACPSLTLDDILSAEVTINSVEQTVTLGGNVDVMTAAHPDPTTGCAGIKFDFGLEKDGGVMTVCFTLRTPFAVGASRVCVKGGQTVLNSLFICGPACSASDTCVTVVAQHATVCVPVTVTPYAYTGRVTTLCCGEPVITAGRAACTGNPNQSCVFTVSQDLCLNIPVTFGADAIPGTAHTLCATPTEGECSCGDTAE